MSRMMLTLLLGSLESLRCVCVCVCVQPETHHDRQAERGRLYTMCFALQHPNAGARPKCFFHDGARGVPA